MTTNPDQNGPLTLDDGRRACGDCRYLVPSTLASEGLLILDCSAPAGSIYIARVGSGSMPPDGNPAHVARYCPFLKAKGGAA